MTVNERLVVAGLFDEFERAAHANETEEVKRILAKVDLSPENIEGVITFIYTSPQSIYRNKR